MGKKDFQDYICRPFCRYFKEDQKEEMACQGVHIIEWLVRFKILDLNTLPRHGKTSSLWEKPDPGLKALICSRCPFQVDGCDYQSSHPPAGTEPCGGYILLSLLNNKGIIQLSDLEKILGK